MRAEYDISKAERKIELKLTGMGRFKTALFLHRAILYAHRFVSFITSTKIEVSIKED